MEDDITHSAPRPHSEDAAAHLEALGLNETCLHNAIIAGESDRSSRGPHDPAIVGGIIAWGACIGNLRSTLLPRGWRSSTYKGLELVLNPAGNIAITVAAGNSYTGVSGPVSTMHPKGLATADLIEFRQLSFFGGEPQAPSAMQLHFLLYHRTSIEIRAELSVPSSYRRIGERQIEMTEWETRIILDPIPLTSQHQPAIEIDSPVDVEVQITPKARKSP